MTREAHNALARKVADESMVLLKNANHTLPLKTSIGTVAVLGSQCQCAARCRTATTAAGRRAQHQVSILDGIRQAVGADHVITTTNLRVPIAGNLALAEPVKADYLFTDASKSKHGLTVAYAANEAGLAQPARTEVSETGAIKRPDAAGGMAYDPTLAVKMTGVLGAADDRRVSTRCQGSRCLPNLASMAKSSSTKCRAGALRTASAGISLEKDKAYNVLVEFSHTPTMPVNATTGQVLSIGTPEGPVTAPPKVGTDVSGHPRWFTTRAAAAGAAVAVAADSSMAQRRKARASPRRLRPIPTPIRSSNSPGPNPPRTACRPTPPGRVSMARPWIWPGKPTPWCWWWASTARRKARSLTGRPSKLPAVQDGLIRAVTRAAGNKPVVVVNCSGSPVALNWASENVPAIIQAWYPGQRGDAVADVLFGKYNPAGRLPMTFYKSNADLPALTDYSMVNRTYRYFTKPVLYPFGHGLSYSTFEYSKLTAPARAGTGEDVKVSVNVKNTSSLDGEEVVQCYLNRDVPAIDPGNTARSLEEDGRTGDARRDAAQGAGGIRPRAAEGRREQESDVHHHHAAVVAGGGQGRQARGQTRQVADPGRRQLGEWAGHAAFRRLTLAGPPLAPKYHFVAPAVN